MAFPEEHLEEMTDHYAKMAMTPGWIDYARHRVAQLQKSDKMYADMGARVKARIEELKNANHS
jgi:hypothetical protein